MFNTWTVFVALRLRVSVFLLRNFFGFAYLFAVRRDQKFAREILAGYGASVRTIEIPSRDHSRKIKAYLYSPPSACTSPETPRPVLINAHGSGFMAPFHGSDAAFCARMAKEVDIYIIDTDYRKAPENPFPAALEDYQDVLDWVATQSERFDASRVAVSGASSGGTLALVAGSTLRKSLRVDIKAVVTNYPVVDLSLGVKDRVIPKPVQPLPPWLIQFFYDQYVPDLSLRKDPCVSPMYARSEDFPSTVIINACEGDTLSMEAKRLAEKLDIGGRTVKNLVWEAMVHGFDVGSRRGTKEWETREQMHALVVEALKDSLGT